MDANRRFGPIVMTAALFCLAAVAHANPALTETSQAGTGIRGIAQVIQADRRRIAQAQIDDAVRELKQAAMQADFASNERELSLLQEAHENLLAAAGQLNGVQRTRAIELLADLDHVIKRGSAELGPLISSTGDTFGPPPPSRNQLAQLANEGQDLERGRRFAHRLLDAVDPGQTSQKSKQVTRAQTQMEQAEIALGGKDLQAWPPDMRATWPRVHFRF